MAKAEIRQSVYRILSDLIKSDNIITVDELNGLDEACVKFGITDEDREKGYNIPLSTAFSAVAAQSDRFRKKVLETMESIAVKDGECCREESLLIVAMEYICEGVSAKVVSAGFKNRPLLKTQLLYIENRKTTPAHVALDSDASYHEIKRIVKMGGLELVYIPRVARHFKDYGNKDSDKGFQALKQLLRLVSPQSNDSDISNAIFSIQGMNSRFFYNNILNGKLDLNFNIENPSWIIRLPDSVVGGVGYSNYFCFDVQDNIKEQMLDFIKRLNKRQTSYSIKVNDGLDLESSFRYNGFFKALLDVMSIKKVDKWDLHIRLYGEGVEQYQYTDENTGERKKCVMTIRRGNDEYPIPLSGRDVAFYLLILCASASDEKGVDFHDDSMMNKTEQRYENIYRRVSRRETDIPMVWIPQSRIPMRSRVAAAINESIIAKHSSLQALYLPEDLRRGFIHTQIEPERVFIDSLSGSTTLKESGLYRNGFLRPDDK